MWKASAKKQSYLVITLHWIDNQWKLRNIVLDFRYIPKKHSGKHIKDATIDTLREHKIAHKVFGVPTDGAFNMIKFFELLQRDVEVDKRNYTKTSPEVSSFWNWCAAHIVNIVAEVATKKKDETVGKIRACVVHLRRATIRESFLEFVKEQDLKLPLDVATRWNSLLHMVEGAYARRHEIRDFLMPNTGAIKSEVPAEEEWFEMADLIELLKPLEIISTDCSAYKNLTFHLGLAELEFLRTHLHNFAEDFTKAHWRCEYPASTFCCEDPSVYSRTDGSESYSWTGGSGK